MLHALKRLEKEGFEVTYLPVDKYGTVELEALYAAARKDTTLITIMAANNEIGTVQPFANRRVCAGEENPVPYGRGAGGWPYSDRRKRDEHRHVVRQRA